MAHPASRPNHGTIETQNPARGDDGRHATQVQTIARLALGGTLLLAGAAHLTEMRTSFEAQVPRWLPAAPGPVVFWSGIVELGLGGMLIALPRHRSRLGWIVAAFFIVIFPANITQYANRADAFGLKTDQARGLRLLFQPLLVLWALWATGAWREWRATRHEC